MCCSAQFVLTLPKDSQAPFLLLSSFIIIIGVRWFHLGCISDTHGYISTTSLSSTVICSKISSE